MTRPHRHAGFARSVWTTVATWAAVAIVSCTPATGEEQRPAPTKREMATALDYVQRIVERYESEQSYRISFRQETYWALADTTIASEGVLLLERPSMLSIRYDDGSMITSNGDTLRVYVSQTNQFFVTAVDADDTVIDPPRVLRQYVPNPDGPFLGSCVGVADGPSSPQGQSSGKTVRATLSLVPAAGAAEPTRLDVTVDPSRNIVLGMVAHTRTGDQTRYHISETLFGVETSPADFAIIIPPGAERIGG